MRARKRVLVLEPTKDSGTTTGFYNPSWFWRPPPCVAGVFTWSKWKGTYFYFNFKYSSRQSVFIPSLDDVMELRATLVSFMACCYDSVFISYLFIVDLSLVFLVDCKCTLFHKFPTMQYLQVHSLPNLSTCNCCIMGCTLPFLIRYFSIISTAAGYIMKQ